MPAIDHVSSPHYVARVRAVSDDRQTLYLNLTSGQFATVSSSVPLTFPVGSTVLVNSDEDSITAAPDNLWPDDSWVGVVRLKHPDLTIIDSSGRWRQVPTVDDVPYSERNTVEARDSGVIRVLSEHPLRYLDLPPVDDTVVDKFRVESTDISDTFADFGGLKSVVARARELIEVPLKYGAQLSAIGARAIKGVLFTGRPGTGKTMLARIIARSTDAAFYEISGPEIFSKWYGQSEEVLRRIFEDASQKDRAIIFFDEIDSLAGQRHDESHEASRRVVAQLLTLMDGFSSDDNIVVIAATNRPQDIDTALRRPGRFDWELEFPLPDVPDRFAILTSAARRLNTEGSLPHTQISRDTEGWSAAELTAIWSEASLLAVQDGRESIMAEDYVAGFERVSAHRLTIPSVPMDRDSR